MKSQLLLLLVGLLAGGALVAQDRAALQAKFALDAAWTDQPVRIDGRLDDAIWQTDTSVADHFALKWPRNGGPSPVKTTVQVAYDAKYLYVGAFCEDSTPNYIVQNLKRDVGYWESDGLSVVLDPTNSTQNGYFFALTPAGVQTEGLLSNVNDEPDLNWDNVWYGEVQHLANGWSLEMAIPLRILRYDASVSGWGVNFIRNDATRGQYDTWVEAPIQFNCTDLGWTGLLQFTTPPVRAKGNYALVPYVSAGANRDFEEGKKWEGKPNVGLDAKLGIGSGLNLDVTVNPDFSQVEIDEQVLNLTRFNIFLPEKRTFFLENADVFGRFGIPPIRPFFSRSIGLDADGQPVPILGGLRLTGNLDANTRIGVLDMHTRATDEQSAQNFSTVAVHRRLSGRNTLGGYFSNRQGFTGVEPQGADFGRNAGAELNLTSPNGLWSGWLTYHHTFKPNQTAYRAGWLDWGGQYASRRFRLLLDFARMGQQYDPALGYETRIRNYDALRDTTFRIPYQWMYAEGSVTFFPKNPETSRLFLTELNYTSFTVLNFDGTLNEQNASVGYNWYFKNTAQFTVTGGHNWYNVPVAFKFDDEDNAVSPPLPAGYYAAGFGGVEWVSDVRRRFYWGLSLTAGEFYNGTQLLSALEVGYRAQPWGNFKIKAEYNRLDFPAPYRDAVLLNLTPRVEIFFNRKLNWTTFVQYNTQADNFNINSRLQWRFRPMSDLFLVFTDNYAVQFWGPKNRAFVAKLSYWW